MDSSSSPAAVVCSVPPCHLSSLCEEYRCHALTTRVVASERAEQECRYLDRFFAYLGPPETSVGLFGAISPPTLNGFLVEYAAEHGLGSRRWMQAALRSFLHFAYQSGYMERDLSVLVPTVRVMQMGHLPGVLDDASIAQLDHSINRNTVAGLRDSAILCLLSTYGIRGVQIRRLRLCNLDWENSRIVFPAAKGGRAVEQWLTLEAGNRLADYISNARPPSSHTEVFLSLREPVRPIAKSSQLSAIIRRRMKQAGVEPPEGVSRGSHGFRHAFATRLSGNVPFKDIVDMLGHRDPSSTLLYGKLDVPTLMKAAVPWPGGAK